MEWLQGNWFWLLFGGFFVWMHLSGRGCCSHGNHGKDEECDNGSTGSDENSNSEKDDDKSKSNSCCH